MPRISNKRKALFDAFGDNYLLLEHDGGYILYDKSRKGNRSNHFYLGKIYFSSDNTKYSFNGNYYNTVDELVKAMEEYNSTLPFDAELYNPMFKKSYLVECASQDYLESIGFKRNGGNVYVLKDAFGTELLTLRHDIEDNTTEGKVIQYLDDNRWREGSFNTLEESMGAINSIVASNCIAIASKAMSVLSKLTSSRATHLLDHEINWKGLAIHTEESMPKLIEILESELTKLKELNNVSI